MSANPFTPTFGHVPYALAGRSDYVDDVIGGLASQPGDPNRTTIFVGPRGSGKTVLLTAIARLADGQGWISANVSARDGMLDNLFWQLRRNAAHLLGRERTSDIVSIQVGPIGATREMIHDEPSWQIRLADLIDELNVQGVGVLFTIDEVNLACKEFGEFIDAYQHFVREGKDVALLMAGLPGRVSALLLDENVSFIRRAFQRPMDAIPQKEVEQALLDTIEGNGRTINPDALARAAEASRGFAYAIQLIGYYLWRQGSKDLPLNLEDVDVAIALAQREMERSVFLPTLRELRPREEQYLRAMARDEGPSTTSDIAARLGIGMTNASNLRRRLIEHGIIREVRMGQVEFEMPLLKEYLQGQAQ